jgi:diacylglycerol kinase family enzyme
MVGSVHRHDDAPPWWAEGDRAVVSLGGDGTLRERAERLRE